MSLPTKELIVRYKAWFERGYSWVKYPRDFLLALASLKILNINLLFTIPIIIGIMIIGFLDFKYGIWKAESIFGSKNVNPFFEALDRKIDKLISLHENK